MAALTTDKLITPTGVVAGAQQTMQTVDITATVAGGLTAAGAVTAGTITIDSGSVTDSSGAIDFGNETLTTTGVVTAGGFVTAGTIKSNSVTQLFSGSKVLTDGAATDFAEIAVADGELIGGNISYTIYVSNATPDYQAHTGGIGFVAVNKAGTVTCDITEEEEEEECRVEIVTSGTLSDAAACTAGAGKITLSMDANTSLAGATITMFYTIEFHSMNVITAL